MYKSYPITLSHTLLFGLIILFCAGIFHPPLFAASDQPTTIPIVEYWQQLAQTQSALAPFSDGANPALRAAVRAEAERWQPLQRVTLPDGTQVAVDASVLLRQLRAQPVDLPRLKSYLTVLLAAQDTWPAVQFARYDPAVLARILARPEFQVERSQPPAFLLQLMEWWARFLRWLERLFPNASTTPASDEASLFEPIFNGVVLLLLAALLFYALQGILADFVGESTLTAQETLQGEPLTADSALRRAQTLSGEGDYRTAVRYLYLSALLRLEEHGVLRYERTLTNREYLKRVAHDPNLLSVLRDVVDVFDRVWYGYQPLDAPTYQRYATAVEALKNYRGGSG